MKTLLFISLCLILSVTVVFAEELPDSSRLADRSDLWEHSSDLLSGFRNMYQCEVVHNPTETEYPWRGWFFGWASEDGNPLASGCDAIYALRAPSLDGPWQVWLGGEKWDDGTNPQLWMPVISARDLPYDEWHNGDPAVVLQEGKYYMAYSSTGRNLDGKLWGEAGDTDGSILCVMGSVSEDGLHWTPTSEPIVFHKEDLGAASVPHGEAHLLGSYHRPTLLYDEDRFKLWFDYWTGDINGTSVGYAENTGDFTNPADWKIVQADDNPVLPQFPNPDVAKIGDVYFAFGDPPTGHPHLWITRKLTEAVSLDGRDWLVTGYCEPEADAPAIHVPQALVVPEGENWWLYVFYACQIGGEPEYDYRYNKIRYMRRLITPEDLDFIRSQINDASKNLAENKE